MGRGPTLTHVHCLVIGATGYVGARLVPRLPAHRFLFAVTARTVAGVAVSRARRSAAG
ncbi:MAG TPA: hypothetical protein VEZ42_13805 [Pseudonocardia sp.]|nr:hypothetical protein [Pseudonocardia sp.]